MLFFHSTVGVCLLGLTGQAYTPKFCAPVNLWATNAAQRRRRFQNCFREMQIQNKMITLVRGFYFWSERMRAAIAQSLIIMCSAATIGTDSLRPRPLASQCFQYWESVVVLLTDSVYLCHVITPND